ncbi:type II toxin-antitoxin system VapC family toxin [Acidobacteria bacterium AH-259-A15]|nr:type II toxin-antitoxin system VapC family toxin [Acidobacteria bacterium AH-259-A15]
MLQGRAAYDLFVSQVVIREAAEGDKEAAARRLSLLHGLRVLALTDEAVELARVLVDQGAVTRTSVEDALHIALATVHGMDYLLTWNCRHIANATMRSGIEAVCRECGYEPPVICTPEELTSENEQRRNRR